MTRGLAHTDSRGFNCCAEIRDILGCGADGSCRGFEGDCADLQTQFADLQGPFTYGGSQHDTLGDYVCHAFPDDAYQSDQFLVGLISVAIAIPVEIFVTRCFEVSNEGEEPEAWLELPHGWKRAALSFFFGTPSPHGRWHYLPNVQEGVPHCTNKLLRWYLRFKEEPNLVTATRLLGWLWSTVRGGKVEPEGAGEVAHDQDADDAGSTSSTNARAEALKKRLLAGAGFLGVYSVWAVFTWCVASAGSCAACTHR